MKTPVSTPKPTNPNTMAARLTIRGSSLMLALLLWLCPALTRAETAIQAWAQRYSSPTLANADDQARAVVADAAGDIIVAGYTIDGVLGQDMLIIKYSSAGVPLWTNRYNGPGNQNDYANAVVVDGNNNVIVTGYSLNSGLYYDYATIKYSSAGVPLWTNRYHGIQNSDDRANAVAVDSSNNVIVTGYSLGHGTSYDYATIKYSSAGAPLWTNRYTGPPSQYHTSDYATAVAVDSRNNVIVTGYSGPGVVFDYVTIQYSSAGTPLWTNHYNGPGNQADFAAAVVVDTNNNVIVTGHSIGSGTTNDYATIKYSSAGIPLWTNRYNGPGNGNDAATALAVDASGNVIVTGYSIGSGTTNDYATIKYSSAGLPLWTNRYDGSGDADDRALAVVVDKNGNVTVTGSSATSRSFPYYPAYATVQYSSAGVPVWTNRYRGPVKFMDSAYAAAVDPDNNVIVTGASYVGGAVYAYDVATLKYSSAGVPLWTNYFNGSGNSSDSASAVVVDGNHNVIVTGYSSSFDDYVTIKYSSTGAPLWINRFSGRGYCCGWISTVAVDSRNDVIVTGSSPGTGGPSDYTTIKYSSAGAPLWTNRYNGRGYSTDVANAVVVDGSDNVIVTGCSWNDGNAEDYATIKYSSAGVPLWTNCYNGPDNADDNAYAVAVDGSGNVIVTGRSEISAGSFVYDYATIKYSSAGAPLWTNRYNGPGNSTDVANDVAVDGRNNVIVTGFSTGSDSSYDYATIKYSSAGLPLWTNRYNGPGNGQDQAGAVAVDGSDNVIVTGYSFNGANDDYVTIKYSSAGLPLWTNRYNGSYDYYDCAYALKVDAADNVIVTGRAWEGRGGSASEDYATIKYSSSGAPLWTNCYNGPANGPDQPLHRSCLALGPDGAVVVTGRSDGDFGAGSNFDFATVKYVSASQLEIIAQPETRTNNVGATATFSVTATGDSPLSYQWRKDGLDLTDGGGVSGATTPELTLTHITTNDAGLYCVLVANLSGQILSSNAVLRVNQLPLADASATVPVVISANLGSTLVALNGSRSSDPDGDPLRYFWYQVGISDAFATGMVAVVTLPVGTNALVLVVDDSLATDDQTFTVEVITGAQAVGRLQWLVQARAAKPRPLLATLSAAFSAIARGNPAAAVNQLLAFQNKVCAQVESSDPALAKQFIQAAQLIIDRLMAESKAHGKITQLSCEADGKARLKGEAAAGALYIIEASTNLVDWEMIGATTSSGGGAFEFEDSNSLPVSARFYRLRWP